jgi:hypothetical protein
MGLMGPQYRWATLIYLTPPFKLKVEVEELKH